MNGQNRTEMENRKFRTRDESIQEKQRPSEVVLSPSTDASIKLLLMMDLGTELPRFTSKHYKKADNQKIENTERSAADFAPISKSKADQGPTQSLLLKEVVV